MRKPKMIDPKNLWIVGDSHRQLTPAFYHEELARAAHKELSKDTESLEVRSYQSEVSDAGFEDALSVLTRETGWLTMAQRDRKSFAALCEGWLTRSMAKGVQLSTTSYAISTQESSPQGGAL